MVSRFRSKAEQDQIIKDVSTGKIDIIVGTHRLLSKDVVFRDLGLLVVDEEQRFGVAHKERIKQMRKKVDVLTMTATPIPRTLNMSLVGIRDMSIIETPPKDRLAIQTNVVKFDSAVISRAIRTELERGGQVYVVHNRVESIYSLGNLITRLVPEARVAIAHGQMGEEALERVMVDFVAQKYDVLLATTIIENGLDIPNANTLIVNRADRYGLAQLYQLRGRVGRSDRRAYAYLIVPPADNLAVHDQTVVDSNGLYPASTAMSVFLPRVGAACRTILTGHGLDFTLRGHYLPARFAEIAGSRTRLPALRPIPKRPTGADVLRALRQGPPLKTVARITAPAWRARWWRGQEDAMETVLAPWLERWYRRAVKQNDQEGTDE